MSECCCEVKMKIDNVDRDRLRDNLIVQRGESNLLRAEFAERRNDGRFFGGHHGHGDGHHGHGDGHHGHGDGHR